VATVSNWSWKKLYEAALLECNLSKLPERIKIAQTAVVERLRCLDGSVSETERLALLDAHNVLCDLCKMSGLSDNLISKASGQ
jgi:hypothetical protein